MFDQSVHRYKGVQTLKKGIGFWFTDEHFFRSKAIRVERKCEKDGELCIPCGFERLCELFLVTGEGQKLGDSDDEKSFPFLRENEEDLKTFRARTSGQMRYV